MHDCVYDQFVWLQQDTPFGVCHLKAKRASDNTAVVCVIVLIGCHTSISNLIPNSIECQDIVVKQYHGER